jgi:hypothetical protein
MDKGKAGTALPWTEAQFQLGVRQEAFVVR